MNDCESSAPAKPRRRWWRFFLQFSLRSLLIVTTLAAVGCWWFLQPETREEQLAGKHLKLRRQVRITQAEAVPNQTATQSGDDNVVLTSVGAWRLLDQNGDVLVAGRYHEDVPHGKWTIYHTNGRKAAEGSVVRGARNGLWRVWNTEGRLQSAVTYRAVPAPPPAPATNGSRHPWGGSPIPVVGAIGPVGQFGTVVFRSGPGGSSQASAALYISQRHGPARVWYSNGKLKFEGHYADDRREGLWTYYDEQGRVVGQGEYRRDLKEGKWRERQTAATGRGLETVEVEYVGGRTRVAHDALLAKLKADLAGNSFQRQVAAVERLHELGGHGVPLLLATIDHPDDNLKVIAVRTVERIVAQGMPQRAFPTVDILAKVQPLMEHADQRLRTHALLIVYRLQPVERSRLLPKLLAAVQASSSPDWQRRTFATVLEAEPERTAETFLALAAVADKHLLRLPNGRYEPTDPHGFVELAAGLDGLPELLHSAAKSPDPRVRRFVLQVVHALVFRGEPDEIKLPGGGVEYRYLIPEEYKELVQRMLADPDTSVQNAAEGVGQSPPPLGFGSGGVF